MKLYVKGEKRLSNDSLYSFLKRVLNINHEWEKARVNETYFDVEFKVKESKKARRSFDDLVSISKTYFRVSDKGVARVIIKLLNENSLLCLVLCDTAKKWVVHYGLYKSNSVKYCARYNYGPQKINNCSEGKYSYNDIMVLAGLKEEKEFYGPN